MLGFKREITPILPDTVFEIFGFPIVNTTIFQFLIVIIVAGVGLYLHKKASATKPGTFQLYLEALYEVVISHVQSVVGSRSKAVRVVPLAASILVFILLQNVFALFPVLTSFTFNGVSVLRTPTADFNTTFGLAVVSIVVIHLAMIKDNGFFGYIFGFVKIPHVISSFKKGFKDGLMSLVDLFIGLLDIVGELAKVLSLSLRLFGNLYAGDVLMGILIGIVAVGVPAIWLLMSTLGAVVQAVVFASLVSVFFSLAIAEET